MPEKPEVISVCKYLKEHLKADMTVGFDGRCVSANFVDELKNALGDVEINIAYERDLVGEIWEGRPVT